MRYGYEGNPPEWDYNYEKRAEAELEQEQQQPTNHGGDMKVETKYSIGDEILVYEANNDVESVKVHTITICANPSIVGVSYWSWNDRLIYGEEIKL